jgi:hypothetical protein
MSLKTTQFRKLRNRVEVSETAQYNHLCSKPIHIDFKVRAMLMQILYVNSVWQFTWAVRYAFVFIVIHDY